MSNLLDSASIVLTPTAYDNGKMLSVKPSVALGPELVTNGDFATDTDWTKGDGWSISGGSANCDGSQSTGTQIYQNETYIINKIYKVTYTVEVTSGTVDVRLQGSGTTVVGNPRTTSGTYTDYLVSTGNTSFRFRGNSDFIGSIDNISVKEDLSGDFDFSRNSAATRVNAQGLVENVQILSGDLVSNGDFSQEGVQEVSNGSFSQEGAEEVTNGNFATDSNWIKQTGWSISGGTANCDGSQNLPESVYQNGVTVVGKTYKITYTLVKYYKWNS